MNKNDWIGMAVSVAIHALLLLVMSVLTVAAVEPPQTGFIEVEFGPYRQGRPVARAEQPREEPVPQTTTRSQQEDANRAPAPQEARPVELPKPLTPPASVDRVQQPEAETIAPQTQPTPRPSTDPNKPADPAPIRPLGSGDPAGAGREQQGTEGAASDDARTAPFQIEGLNRVPVSTALPGYSEQVNATIRVRITVDPTGRISQRIPLIKGNPRLEAAVMEALLNWRFNPLPPNAPQESQTGIITFTFRLR